MVNAPLRQRQPDFADPDTGNVSELSGEASPASLSKQPIRDFSFHLFFLVFWLTLIATVLISWQMIVVQP